MIKAVFFDFGGTLMDDNTDRLAHLELMRSVGRHFGLHATGEELLADFREAMLPSIQERPHRWITFREIASTLLGQILEHHQAQPATDEDLAWFWDEYFRLHYQICRLFPGVEETLRDVRSRDLHLGLISDIDDEYLYDQMRLFDIDRVFDSITTSDAVGVGKPNPKIFQIALDAAGVKGEESIYVGDSIRRDVMGSKAMGMVAVWFRSEGECPEADYTIRSLVELTPILEAADQHRSKIHLATDLDGYDG
jgi:HAD superfamily hydrolase (TIGR01509 family)